LPLEIAIKTENSHKILFNRSSGGNFETGYLGRKASFHDTFRRKVTRERKSKRQGTWSKINFLKPKICIKIRLTRYRGHAVVPFAKALGYKPEVRGFYSRWCHWNCSLTLWPWCSLSL